MIWDGKFAYWLRAGLIDSGIGILFSVGYLYIIFIYARFIYTEKISEFPLIIKSLLIFFKLNVAIINLLIVIPLVKLGKIYPGEALRASIMYSILVMPFLIVLEFFIIGAIIGFIIGKIRLRKKFAS